MEITYSLSCVPAIEQIIEVYTSSGINRPVADAERIRQMYEHSNLIVTAWVGGTLVGVARSVTDFSYCCYLSDLAVRKEFQNRGVGRKLVQLTKDKIGDKCMLLLLSAPSAMEYYPKIGFDRVENGFIIKRTS